MSNDISRKNKEVKKREAKMIIKWHPNKKKTTHQGIEIINNKICQNFDVVIEESMTTQQLG